MYIVQLNKDSLAYREKPNSLTEGENSNYFCLLKQSNQQTSNKNCLSTSLFKYIFESFGRGGGWRLITSSTKEGEEYQIYPHHTLFAHLYKAINIKVENEMKQSKFDILDFHKEEQDVTW